jgi:hypothetical protein
MAFEEETLTSVLSLFTSYHTSPLATSETLTSPTSDEISDMRSALRARRAPKPSVIPALSTADRIIASLDAEETEIDAKTRQIDPEIADLEERLKVSRERLENGPGLVERARESHTAKFVAGRAIFKEIVAEIQRRAEVLTQPGGITLPEAPDLDQIFDGVGNNHEVALNSIAPYLKKIIAAVKSAKAGRK